VLSRAGKLILGVIMLLSGPGLGQGGRVDAGFALARCLREPERPRCSFEFEVVLNGEEAGETARSCSPGGMAEESTSTEGTSHRKGLWLPREPILVHAGFQSGGTSSAPGPSPGPGGGAGGNLIPVSCDQVVVAEGCGRLFLAEERFKPALFPARLFRPPRLV
jgi:hypothetical protein